VLWGKNQESLSGGKAGKEKNMHVTKARSHQVGKKQFGKKSETNYEKKFLKGKDSSEWARNRRCAAGSRNLIDTKGWKHRSKGTRVRTLLGKKKRERKIEFCGGVLSVRKDKVISEKHQKNGREKKRRSMLRKETKDRNQ